MRDHVARELKGHNILAVERFQDKTRWMVEFSVLRPRTAYGAPGDETRLFLDEDGYQAVLASQKRRDSVQPQNEILRKGVWGWEPPTSKNSFPAGPPESCFEHLWEQMYCLLQW